MPDDQLLANVMRRILTAGNGWSMTYRDLTLNTTLDNLDAEERAALGRATGNPTIADPLLRSKPNPTPQDLEAIALRRQASLTT